MVKSLMYEKMIKQFDGIKILLSTFLFNTAVGCTGVMDPIHLRYWTKGVFRTSLHPCSLRTLL